MTDLADMIKNLRFFAETDRDAQCTPEEHIAWQASEMLRTMGENFETQKDLVERAEAELKGAWAELRCCDDINLDKGLAAGIAELQTDRERQSRLLPAYSKESPPTPPSERDTPRDTSRESQLARSGPAFRHGDLVRLRAVPDHSWGRVAIRPVAGLVTVVWASGEQIDHPPGHLELMDCPVCNADCSGADAQPMGCPLIAHESCDRCMGPALGEGCLDARSGMRVCDRCSGRGTHLDLGLSCGECGAPVGDMHAADCPVRATREQGS